MPVYYEKPKPLLKRVPQINDTSEKIQRYDVDNLYPQRMEELVRRSSTLKSLMNRIADFINGEGFTDPTIAQLIVNRKGLKGQSLNKVLQITSKPYSRYETVPMHIGYNLLGSICALNPLPIETIRFGLRNKQGRITHLAYSANWEKDGRSVNDQAICFYPTFDPNPETVLNQMAAAGGIARYKGQILYLTPDDGQYPFAVFDAIADDAQVQSEIGLFKVGNIQNSFMATLAILYPGEFSSAQEENDFRDLITNKSGSRNAGGRIGLQDKTGNRKASDIFQSLSPTNLDKLFEYTERSVKENIVESEAFPAMLMGKTPTGLFAQGDMEEAYTYVNAITRNRRSQLSEIFSLLLSHWEDPIVSDCSIIEQRYIRQSAEGSAVDINDNLKGMSGREAINFARILRKYAQGKYDRATAETLLRSGFGLSDAEIAKLLDGLDSAAAEETAQPEVKQEKIQSFIVSMAREML
jgi:hypothetical protein